MSETESVIERVCLGVLVGERGSMSERERECMREGVYERERERLGSVSVLGRVSEREGEYEREIGERVCESKRET